jgi:hypothetical protein
LKVCDFNFNYGRKQALFAVNMHIPQHMPLALFAMTPPISVPPK